MDLDRIVQYYHEQGVLNLDESIIQPILMSIDWLRHFPRAGHRRKKSFHRSLIQPPYRIEYRFEGDSLVITAIWDTRRNPDDLPG
jgi:plasmid stabilization system protein ParE